VTILDTFHKEGSGRSIIFEEIGFLSIPLLVFYLIRGYGISFFSINKSLERNRIIRNLVQEKRLIKIDYSDLDIKLQFDLNNIVLDKIEVIFNENFQKNKTIEEITALVGSDSVANAFKKALSNDLYEFYRMNLVFDSFFSQPPQKTKLLFVPGRIYRELKNISQVREIIATKKNITTPFCGRVFACISGLVLQLKYSAILLGFPFWILCKIKIPSVGTEEKKNYLVGVRLSYYGWPPGNKYRSFDFLIDNIHVTKNDVLFCLEEPVPADINQKILDNRYNHVEIRDILKNATFTYCRNTFFKSFFPTYAACLKHSFTEPPFVVQLCCESLFRFLLWRRFEDKYAINHYVTYDEYHPSDIVRNIVLENQGTSTWMYAHSISTPDFYSPPGYPDFKGRHYAYFQYDNFVVWGEKMERYYRKHPNSIKNFHKLGCLWSEHVRIISDQGLENITLKALQQKCLEKDIPCLEKVIGVFDDSVSGETALHEPDIIEFIDKILQILEDYPTFGIIFKKKRSFVQLSLWNPTLVPYYQKLKNHPRCYLTEELGLDPSETIAAADLVISAAFTTPTIEALCAKKRAIYFDPTGKFRETYFDKFPGFVAHDYTELKKAIDYWLNEMSDQQFHAFLDRYVLHELDEYLDGMAITRFRQKLCVERNS
jgi:polysaccharide biosynthesis PFTS motif protein